MKDLSIKNLPIPNGSFASLHNTYLASKALASRTIKHVLNQNWTLANYLVEACTTYKAVSYVNGVQVKKDKDPQLFLELAHCQFYLPLSVDRPVVTVYLMVNLSAYRDKKEDIIYSYYWRSNDDGEDQGYIKFLDEAKDELNGLYKEFGSKALAFYRYLPFLEQMGDRGVVLEVFNSLKHRETGHLSSCELIDFETSKTKEWV